MSELSVPSPLLFLLFGLHRLAGVSSVEFLFAAMARVRAWSELIDRHYQAAFALSPLKAWSVQTDTIGRILSCPCRKLALHRHDRANFVLSMSKAVLYTDTTGRFSSCPCRKLCSIQTPQGEFLLVPVESVVYTDRHHKTNFVLSLLKEWSIQTDTVGRISSCSF